MIALHIVRCTVVYETIILTFVAVSEILMDKTLPLDLFVSFVIWFVYRDVSGDSSGLLPYHTINKSYLL